MKNRIKNIENISKKTTLFSSKVKVNVEKQK